MASDDEAKSDSERKGDVADEIGNASRVWRRQSVIGMWKGSGGKVVTLPPC